MANSSTDFLNPNFSPKTLVELVRWRAKTMPDQRAYTYLKDGEEKEIRITYAEIDRRARAIASYLQDKGLTGERALLLYPPGLDYLIGFFGCLYAGVIAVPAYPPDPNRLNRTLPRLQSIVRDAGATVALTTDSILYMIKMLRVGTKLSDTLEKLPLLRRFQSTLKNFSPVGKVVANSSELTDLQWISTDSVPAGLAADWSQPKINGDSIAFLQYTSGSTGTPKGVMLTHTNLLINSAQIFEAFGYLENSEGVIWLPIYHDMGLIGGILQPLYAGLPATLLSPIHFLQRPMRWLEAISRIKDKPIISGGPNFSYDLCIKKASPQQISQLDLSNWHVAFSGAEPVRAQTIERFSEIFKPAGFRKEAFFPCYGLAEATLFVTGCDPKTPPSVCHVDSNALSKGRVVELAKTQENALSMVSCGHTPFEQQVVIVNPESKQECQTGEIGEIWVKGPNISQGYWKRQSENVETFQARLAGSGDGPFLRTGDLGFMRGQELYIAGRLKDLIIVRGRNYYPQDIEFTVENCHGEIRPGCSAAFSIEEENNEHLIVVAELRNIKNIDFDQITNIIRQTITETFDISPRSIVLIRPRTISKTSSGKIQRHHTRQEFLEGKLNLLHEWHIHQDFKLPPLQTEIPESFELPVLDEPFKEFKTKETVLKTEAIVTIEHWLVNHLAEALGVKTNQIDSRQPFSTYGLDSAQAIGMVGELEVWLDRSLSPTVIWDYPNIEALAIHLGTEGVPPPREEAVSERPALENEAIAIIGYSLRLPGANDTGEFWQNLVNGIDSIREVPAERWNVADFYDPNPGTPGKMVTRWGGFLSDVDKFDANFFGISPREATHIDPQQRLLLEVTWEAFENAGLTWSSISNQPVGVFVGISGSDYSRLQSGDFNRLDAYSGTGNAFSIAANRISYVFDLKGPSFPVDTACSSSLVSVHNAVTSLRRGESSMAVAAGVNLILAPDITITFSQARMMAPDGRCKTFDDNADGYVRGEGVGVVILKRLSDAIRDGDKIRAVIRGSAINQDGRSNGITAPNGLAQQAVLRLALKDARLSANQVGYFEAHGTGTSLGDPIEVNAMKAVMAVGRSDEQPLILGSVKTNIGHLESAAGIAGLIKTTLTLEHEFIPRILHYKKLNKLIKLEDSNIIIASADTEWRRGQSPRFAGVSAYGFGGANAHLVLQEAPQIEKLLADRQIPENLNPLILPVSAHQPEALNALAERYAHFLESNPAADTGNLIDMIYSASVRRSHYEERAAVIGQNRTEIIESLQALAHGQTPTTVVRGFKIPNSANQIVFVFSGQGPQWFAMGRQLMENEPVYRQTIEEIGTLLQEYASWSLPEELKRNEETTKVSETEIAQPAIFAMQVALTRLWAEKGIRPAAVVGHSVGEVAAAYISGTLSLPDAVKVIYHRSRLMQKATGFGRMASVELPLEETAQAINEFEGKLALGAHNSPTNTVISGEPEAMQLAVKKLEAKGVFVRELKVNYAFHSQQMDAFKAELIDSLQGIEVRKPEIPVYSTVSGKISTASDFNPEYWAENIRQRVQFAEATANMIDDGYQIFLELAPHPVLSAALGQCLRGKNIKGHILTTVRRKEDELRQMAITLASLYTLGLSPEWEKLLPVKGRFIPLPALPWQKGSYWFDLKGKGPEAAPLYRRPATGEINGHPLLGQRRHAPLNPGKHYWETEINSEILPFLQDHKVQDSVVLPATGYLEMALAAAAEINGQAVLGLQDVAIYRALFLPEEKGIRTQMVVTPYTSALASFQIFALSDDGSDKSVWNMHSMGLIQSAAQAANGKPDYLLEDLRKRCNQNLAVGDFYEKLKQRGLQYGQHFQGVQELFGGTNEALGRVVLNDEATRDSAHYQIHPALLDACFHVLSAAIPAEMQNESQDTYMPVAIKEMKIYGAVEKELWSYARFDQNLDAEAEALFGNIIIFDAQQNLLVEINGLKLQRLGQRREADLSDFFYKLDWQEAPAAKTENAALPAGKSGSWLIFADQSGEALKLAEQLSTRNDHIILTQPGSDFKHISDSQFEVDPSKPEDFAQLIQTVSGDNYPPLKGILHFWALDSQTDSEATITELSHLMHHQLGSSLFLAQAVSAASKLRKPHLYYITRGLFNLTGSNKEINLFQAPLWGLGRVISSENPDLICVKIDLPLAETGQETTALLSEIDQPDRENQIAWRDGRRYALRLVRSREDYRADETAEMENQQLLEVPEQPFTLDIPTPGVLTALRFKTVPRPAPENGQVEIEVQATGLNFRDVLMALGLYPGDPIPLGSECSGIISRVGPGVSDLKAGDAVLAVAPNTFGKYVCTLANLVVPKPETLPFEEGATIPITFLTAYYALVYLGRLQKGEKILIHAGAGGVGQAAIQIAQMIGAEIFTTAGSAEKQEYLRQMNIPHILNSRTLDFADDIMAITGGEGVDMVLNSLAGEFIPRSLALLKPYGRFLEIGKTDIYQNSQMDLYPFRRNLSYFAIDLDLVLRDKPLLGRQLFLELIAHFNDGKLKALPLTNFSAADTVKAFRYMAQRKNIGKVVVSMKLPARDKVEDNAPEIKGIRPDVTYLITGGLGSLGLVIAEWLASHGARHLVLLTHSGRRENVKAKIESLQEQGVQVVIARGNVSDFAEMELIFKDISEKMPDLKGIFHLAGVLDDGPISSMSWAQFERVLLPKIQGSWVLHQLSRSLNLDFFSLFSSVAAITGNPGQANYAAANIFLDHLATYRRSQGLPGQSINWGFWESLGMAAEDKNNKKVRGSRLIKQTQGLQILDRLINRDIGQTAVTPVVWPELLEPYTKETIPPLYLMFADQKVEKAVKSSATGKKITAGQLRPLPAADRLNLVAEFLRQEIARILGVSAAKLELDKPLNTMGIDSLLAIELKNSVESRLDVSLPIATLLEGPPILVMAADMVEQLVSAPAEEAEKSTLQEIDETQHPLTFGQRAMWFQHQLAPASIYNQVYAVHIPDKLDIDRLRQAIDLMSRRHESLRTNFITRNGKPERIVHDQPQEILHIVDSAGKTDAEINELMYEQINRPFNLESDTLSRVIMFSRNESDHTFLFVGHHIISDMWSLAIFMYELNQIYSKGEKAELAPLVFTYSDYVKQQNRQLTGAIGRRHEKYWLEQLKGDLPVLNLATDFPRPAIQTFHGDTTSIRIDAELTTKLKDLALKQSGTLFTVLLSAFNSLLYRYTSQEEIIVGTPTTGRTSPEYAPILGYFVNPVAIRSKNKGQQTFEAYLNEMNVTMREALDHQDYPFNLVVEKLQPRRDPSRTPIFQIMFVYQKAYLLHESGMSGMAVEGEGGSMKLGDITLESIAIEDRVLPFDMTLIMAELENGLGASLQYNVALFRPETAANFLRHYLKLLQAIAEQPEKKISDYSFLSDEELSTVLNRWNQTKTIPVQESCIQELFQIQAEHSAQNNALFADGRTMSYASLNANANQLARYLVAQGIGPDMIVGISAERSMDMIIAMLAILKAGGAYLPLDPAYPAERLAYMLEDSGANLVLTQKNLRGKLPNGAWSYIVIEEALEQVANFETSNLPIRSAALNLAYVIYTSGSTGKPKGVMLTHAGLQNLVQAQIREFRIEPSTRLLQFASFSFDAAASEIFTTLLCGATLYLLNQETLLSGPDLVQFIRDNEITTCTLPPSVLRVLPPEEIPGLKHVVSAGEPCTPEIAQRWSENRHLINAYGPTEGTICASLYHVDGTTEAPTIPIGNAIDNVRIYILDEFLNPVAPGMPGELFIAGSGVARGYIGRPGLTATQFIPDPFSEESGGRMYRTGDLVRYSSTGNIEFLDRIDNQIKIRGFRIELGEIEARLKEHETILNAIVIASGGTDKRLVSYIIPVHADELTEESVKYHLRQTLPDYMIPVTIIKMEQFPLTANGKIDYKALPKPDVHRAQFVKAETETERKLAEIWQEALNLPEVGINDNFFELGGHSLTVVQIQNLIKERFDREINVVDLFRYPTIGSLSQFMNEGRQARQTREETQVRVDKQRQAMDAQRERMKNRRTN